MANAKSGCEENRYRLPANRGDSQVNSPLRYCVGGGGHPSRLLEEEEEEEEEEEDRPGFRHIRMESR